MTSLAAKIGLLQRGRGWKQEAAATVTKNQTGIGDFFLDKTDNRKKQTPAANVRAKD